MRIDPKTLSVSSSSTVKASVRSKKPLVSSGMASVETNDPRPVFANICLMVRFIVSVSFVQLPFSVETIGLSALPRAE